MILINPVFEKPQLQQPISGSSSPTQSRSRSLSPQKTQPNTPCSTLKRKNPNPPDFLHDKRPKLPHLIRSPTGIEDNLNVLKTFKSVVPSAVPPVLKSMSMPDLRQLQVNPQWPKRIVIIRHGESEQNSALDVGTLSEEQIEEVASIRDADIKLTEKGSLQAEKTGEYLASTEKFDICFVSPYQRTIDTATQILSKFSYPLKMFKDNCLRLLCDMC